MQNYPIHDATDDDERRGHGLPLLVSHAPTQNGTPTSNLGPHAELAKRLYIAVASYRASVSYATQEKRMDESREMINPSWGVVATKLVRAMSEAVSERLLSIFG